MYPLPSCPLAPELPPPKRVPRKELFGLRALILFGFRDLRAPIASMACMRICMYAYMVRRLAFPAPPPMVWSGTGWGGGRGAGVCGERWGPLGLQLEKRPGVTDQASIVRKPYASHKSKNVAQ